MAFTGNAVEVSEAGTGDTVQFGSFCRSRGSAVVTMHFAAPSGGNLSKKT